MLRNFWLCNCPEENSMALDVPEPIAEYLAAEKAKDADAVCRCFTEDGNVHDEGHDYHGRDSIRQWKQAADAKYRYALQMLNAQTHGNEVTVRARLTGEFPGSPVELDHIFKLSNNKIASLEIRS
jgi:ketosteroid isomerase-like protein